MTGSRLARASAVVGLAAAQLRRSPRRTALSVGAVALAVLSVTLLASLGIGVFEVGQESLDEVDRDVWITSDPVDGGTGSANAIVDAHAVALETTAREDVEYAAPIATHEVYVGEEPDDLKSTTAVGIHQTHDSFSFEDGRGFETGEETVVAPPADPGTSEVVLDPAQAEALGVEVGDTVYLGASRETAADNEFTVVGTSGYYSQFLGEPAATVPFIELQGVAGTRGADRATFITVNVESGADEEAVRDDLAERYPEYDVRTSDDQLASMIHDRALVVAGGVTLVALATIGGVVLTANLFVLVAYQQRRELAALGAIGLSRGVLAGIIAAQAFLIGLLGGLLALAATPPLTAALNRLAGSVVGFDSILRTPLSVYAVGLAVAVCVGTVAAVAAGWRARGYGTIEHLDA